MKWEFPCFKEDQKGTKTFTCISTMLKVKYDNFSIKTHFIFPNFTHTKEWDGPATYKYR